MRISLKESFERAPVPDITGKARKVANNTFQFALADGSKVTRLHTTDIVKEFSDGRYQLNTGGWQTVTTKDRLNRFAPCMVYSIRGVWHVDHAGKTAPFFDGMIIPDDMGREGRELVKNQRALAKRINAFVRQIDKLDKLPLPNPGDCWTCSLFNRESPQGERDRSNYYLHGARGIDVKRDNRPDCLESHLDENYLHGSLIVNAMRWAGYRDEGIGMLLHGMGSRVTVKSALRRYLRRKLGLST